MNINRFFLLFLPFVLVMLLSMSKAQADSQVVELYEFNLQDLGYDTSLKAYGVDGSVGFDFMLPSYEKIHQLDMDFRYRVSPDLLEDLSHLVIYLNDKVVSVVEVDQEQKGSQQQKNIQIPVELLEKKNVIEMQLIGHYTLSCEDPMHASLWLEVDTETALTFQVQNRQISNDLSFLPAPFFENGSKIPLQLPFALYDTSPYFLEAAASVASWFGIKAGYQGAKFPVFIAKVPEQGHAVVMINGSERLDWLPEKVQQVDSFIGMVENPNDSSGRFLLIKGKGAEQIKRASQALALAGDVLSGSEATPTYLEEKKRKPYDAPAWIDTTKIVTLRELAPNSPLTANGFFANDVKVGLRLPPDLYSWKNKEVPLNLRYRYSLQASQAQARLQVQVNHNNVASIALENREQVSLGSIDAKPGFGEQVIPLSLENLGSIATLQFGFNYQVPALKACQNSIVDSYRSSIDPESTIDLRGFPHFSAMPNLATFATAGFPYTKMADLSETVVVLSDKATEYEYATFLTLMGKIAADTGYPTTRLHVSNTDDTQELKNKDVILFSFNQTHPLLNKWTRALPKAFADGVKDAPSVLNQLRSWVTFDNNSTSHLPSYALTDGLVLTQFESPVTNKRTVVVLSAKKAENAFDAIKQLIQKPDLVAKIQGEISSIGRDGVESALGTPYYYVGQLTLWMTMLWHLEQHPFLLILLFLIGALLMSLVLYWLLRVQALRRLYLNTKINQNEKESTNA